MMVVDIVVEPFIVTRLAAAYLQPVTGATVLTSVSYRLPLASQSPTPAMMARRAGLFAVCVASMLAGARVVHELYRPDVSLNLGKALKKKKQQDGDQ